MSWAWSRSRASAAAEIAALRSEVGELRALVTHLYRLLDEPLPERAIADPNLDAAPAGGPIDSSGASMLRSS